MARMQSRTRDYKPTVIVVLYTDLLFQLPPTLTSGAHDADVLDMRYVACGERPLKNK